MEKNLTFHQIDHVKQINYTDLPHAYIPLDQTHYIKYSGSIFS
jgi:hypothetical protein